MNAAQTERNVIEQMFDRAESKRDYPGSYFPAKMKAEAALKAWREKYPREAAMEAAQRLRTQAEQLKSKALGALTYDSDGWLSALVTRLDSLPSDETRDLVEAVIDLEAERVWNSALLAD